MTTKEVKTLKKLCEKVLLKDKVSEEGDTELEKIISSVED